jgi:hypothetical protein
VSIIVTKSLAAIAGPASLRGTPGRRRRGLGGGRLGGDGNNASIAVGSHSDNPNLSDASGYACCLK